MKRAPSAASALSFNTSKKAVALKCDVSSELETALLSACKEGDGDKLRQVIEKIQRKQEATSEEAIEELFACAFARAAGCSHVAVMEMLLSLDSSFPTLAFASAALCYGVCRFDKYFPPVVPHQMQSCFALRYVGYAAVMCVEHNAVNALRLLIDRHLLEDDEIVRCFALAKQKAIRFDAPNPGAYRPMLMLLIAKHPRLLQLSTAGTSESATDAHSERGRDCLRFMRALESSLVYEYKLNQQATDIGNKSP